MDVGSCSQVGISGGEVLIMVHIPVVHLSPCGAGMLYDLFESHRGICVTIPPSMGHTVAKTLNLLKIAVGCCRIMIASHCHEACFCIDLYMRSLICMLICTPCIHTLEIEAATILCDNGNAIA